MATLSSNITKMLQRLSFILMLFSITGLHAQAQDARVVTRIVTDTMPSWKTWKAGNGTMNYPGTWEVDSVVSGDTAVIFRKLSSGPVSALPMVSLMVQDLKRASSKERIQVLRANDIRIIASTEPDASGAYSIEYTGTMDGILKHGLEIFRSHDGRSYTLTYSATAQGYDEHLFLAEAMMNSFSPSADR